MNFKSFVKSIIRTQLNESTINLDAMIELAKQYDYDTFLDKTDSLVYSYNILYRGSDDFAYGHGLENDTFMTDSISHARNYGEAVEGIIFNHRNEVLYFDNNEFDELRDEFRSLTKSNLKPIYLPYIKNNKLNDVADFSNIRSNNAIINFVYKFIQSDLKYSQISQTKNNDFLIPIMQLYAKKHGKNIISFWGGDYGMYGGAEEYVVHDVSKYKTLKSIWKEANANKLTEAKKSNRTELNDNFWKWFGNSKVVENGNPIICYHGTDAEFKAFNKNKIGDKHWQSKSDAYGGGFFFTDNKKKASDGGIVKDVYLKIKNPLLRELDDKYGYESDYYSATDMYDNNSMTFLQTAKENRNDGIIIKTPRGSLYIVFKPNQIKSVDNDGSWDINDDNIYS